MNASELKRKVEANNPESLFFSRNNMKFHGDTMRNYGVREVIIMTQDGEKNVWELYRRNPTAHGLYKSVYWDKDTFQVVYPLI